ncbi:hypothetical protein VP01_4099g1, partial [Puccinia sorghi]
GSITIFCCFDWSETRKKLNIICLIDLAQSKFQLLAINFYSSFPQEFIKYIDKVWIPLSPQFDNAWNKKKIPHTSRIETSHTYIKIHLLNSQAASLPAVMGRSPTMLFGLLKITSILLTLIPNNDVANPRRYKLESLVGIEFLNCWSLDSAWNLFPKGSQITRGQPTASSKKLQKIEPLKPSSFNYVQRKKPKLQVKNKKKT